MCVKEENIYMQNTATPIVLIVISLFILQLDIFVLSLAIKSFDKRLILQNELSLPRVLQISQQNF